MLKLSSSGIKSSIARTLVARSVTQNHLLKSLAAVIYRATIQYDKESTNFNNAVHSIPENSSWTKNYH